jgi:hypothetical protein
MVYSCVSSWLCVSIPNKQVDRVGRTHARTCSPCQYVSVHVLLHKPSLPKKQEGRSACVFGAVHSRSAQHSARPRFSPTHAQCTWPATASSSSSWAPIVGSCGMMTTTTARVPLLWLDKDPRTPSHPCLCASATCGEYIRVCLLWHRACNIVQHTCGPT